MNSAEASAVPAPLAKPTPRQTALWGTGAQTIASIGFLLLSTFGVWAVLGFHLWHEMQTRDALRIQSNQVFADDWYIRKGTLYYTFTVSGQNYHAESAVDHTIPLVPHSPVLIRYLPSNPAVSHPAAWEWSPNRDLFFSIIPSSMLVPAIALFLTLRKERWLLTNGTPAPAEITSSTRGSKGGIRLNYQFRTPDGCLYPGKGPGADLKDTGAPIWILYDPADPYRNQPYPAPNYRAIP